MSTFTRRQACLSLLAASLSVIAPIAAAQAPAAKPSIWAPGTTTWDQLPDFKRAKTGLYLTPQQAFDMKTADPKGVAFFDIRTKAEVQYVGMATPIDFHVPYVEHQSIWTDWDDKRGMYKIEPNQDFIPEIKRRLTQMGLNQNSPIILMCRSGDRSSKAADRLLEAGFTKVYGIPEGFEGDMGKQGAAKGRRAVNGWKNAGLPWGYKLDKTKLYFDK